MKKYIILFTILFFLFYYNVRAVCGDNNLCTLEDDKFVTDSNYSFSPVYSGIYELSPTLNNWTTKCNGSENISIGCRSFSAKGDYAGLKANDTTTTNLLNEGKLYIIYKKVGYYNGKQLDMKVTLVDIDWKGNTAGSFLFKTGNSMGVYNVSVGAQQRNNGTKPEAMFIYHLNYIYSDGSGNPGDGFKSSISFGDMDFDEYLSFHESNYYKTYIMDTRSYLGKQVNHISISHSGERYLLEPTQNLALKCKGEDDDKLVQEVNCGKSGIETAYISYPNEKISSVSGGLQNFFSKTGTATVLLKKSDISLGWSGYYLSFESTPFGPALENSIYKKVKTNASTSYGTSSTMNLDKNNDSKYDVTYSIDLNVPKQHSYWKYSEWIIRDTLPDGLKFKYNNAIKNIKVVDSGTGEDVTWCFKSNASSNLNGSVSIEEGKKIVLKASPNYMKKSTCKFYGRNYTVYIYATLNDEWRKKSASVINGQILKNKANHSYTLQNINTNNTVNTAISSNEVTTKIKKTEIKGKITIIKKLGEYSDDGTTYGKYLTSATFKLYKCNGNDCSNKVAEGKTRKDKYGDQILTFNNIENGNYKLLEVSVAGDIKEVEFRTKGNNDGNYIFSQSLGKVSVTTENNTRVARSNSFSFNVSNGEKRIAVYNNPEKIIIKKFLGTGSSNQKKYLYDATFELYKKENDKWMFMGKKTIDSNSGSLVFTMHGTGQYRLKELNINSNIKKVYFYTDNTNDYIGQDVGSEKIVEFYFDYNSNTDNNKVYRVYNEPRENTTDIIITKKLGVYGFGGVNSDYDGVATFDLCKSDPSGKIIRENGIELCKINIKKPKNKSYVITGNDTNRNWYITPGWYVLRETSIPEDIKKVSFKAKNISEEGQIGVYGIDLGTFDKNDDRKAVSNAFEIKTGQSKYYIAVFNDNGGDNCGCQCQLDKIKKEYGTSISDNNMIASVTNELEDLYLEYDDFNLIKNYGYDSNGNLDISQTTCSSVDCSNSDDSENLSCQSGNVYYGIKNENIPKDESGNKVVTKVYNNACFDIDNSEFTFRYDEYDLNCGVSYNYQLTRFSYERVNNGRLLWQNIPNGNLNWQHVGDLTVNLECSKAFRRNDDDSFIPNDLANMKLDLSSIINDLNPSLNGSLDDDLDVSQDFNFILDNNEKISPTKSMCNNDDCYAYWKTSFTYDINYKIKWYTLDPNSGIFYNDTNGDDYRYRLSGSGFPIAIDTQSGDKIANFSFNLKFNRNDSYSHDFTCSYIVENNDTPFNFDYRIIDTDNPFPGLSGNGRSTGENWCESANIGKIYRINDDFRIIGDINGDGKIDPSDVSNLNLSKVSDLDDIGKKIADVNGDNNVDQTDKDILDNYSKGKLDIVCSNNNSVVDHYIKNASSSDSNETPMYSFTLTPNDIDTIREYNKKNSYSDYLFTYSKDNSCRNCLSKFLTAIGKDNENLNGVNINIINIGSSRCYTERFVNNNWCSN